MRALVALAVLGLALAGCTTPAAQVSPDPSGASVQAPGASVSATASGAAVLGGEALAPFALYLTPDLGFSVEPSTAGTVTLTTPVNGPFTQGYPTWTGTLPAAVNLTRGGVAVTLYVQTNSASVRANQVPVFADLPAMFLGLTVGNRSLGAQADGPPEMHAGHVYEVNATLVGDEGWVPAGAEVAFQAAPIYTHVTEGAEFQFAMGPDKPARLDFA